MAGIQGRWKWYEVRTPYKFIRITLFSVTLQDLSHQRNSNKNGDRLTNIYWMKLKKTKNQFYVGKRRKKRKRRKMMMIMRKQLCYGFIIITGIILNDWFWGFVDTPPVDLNTRISTVKLKILGKSIFETKFRYIRIFSVTSLIFFTIFYGSGLAKSTAANGR